MSFDVDADVQEGLKSASAAADQDKIAGITASKPTSETKYDDPVDDWMLNLPKNVTVGVMDAARNTVNSVNAFGNWLDNNLKDKERAYREQGIEGAGPPAPSAQELRMRSMEQGASAGADDLNPFSEHHAFGQQFAAFRDELAKGSSMSDSITQGIAQFAVPMLGWSKALGVQKAISVAGFGAEAATASTALEPHSGRTADLLAMGRSVEGKLGETLRDISPDGSALNAYINYMTDRPNEGAAEGRFKNVVDSTVSSVVGAALLKTGATTIKAAQNLPAYIADNAGVPRVGPGAQEGKIVFHGSRHTFDEFDSSKIGSGEGAQAFGHGLYFAEDPSVAGSYKQAGGPFLEHKGQQVFAEEWDGEPVKGAVKDLVLEGNRRGLTDSATQTYAASQIKRFPDEYGLKNRAQQMQALEILKDTRMQRGGLYHVDVPDEHIDKMLDWDKPLSEQPEVAKAFASEGLTDTSLTGEAAYKKLADILEPPVPPDPAGYPKGWGSLHRGDEGQKPASAALSKAGIPGIKYLDRGSRNAGTGTRNLVLFDAKHAKIVKKE